MTDKLDPRVEAADIAYSGTINQILMQCADPNMTIKEARMIAMVNALAAADAARPAMTAEDEALAWNLIVENTDYDGDSLDTMRVLPALREHFDITPKAK